MKTSDRSAAFEPASSGVVWVRSAALVAALYAWLAIVFVPRFETMDDVAMAMWSSGLCLALSPQSHLIFTQEIVGWLLQHLYQSWPGVGWYGWGQAAVLFAASVAVCGGLWRVGGRAGLLAFLAYFGLTQVDAFVQLQFTKTAFYATLAGTVLLALAMSGPRRNRLLLVAACILTLAGSFIRPESFVFALAVCLPALTIDWWRRDGSLAMSFRRRGTRLGLLVIPPLGFIAAGSVADRTGSWATYYNYRVVRSQAADFGGQIVYNEQTRPIFDQIHWTENHLAMLRQASYFDPVVFSADNLRFLLAKFPRRLVPEGAGGHLREFATPSRPRFTPASCLQAERSFSPPWGAGPGLPCWRPG